MAHTHTLEIITPNVNLIAEKSFKNGQDSAISLQAVTMSKTEHLCIDKLLRCIDELYAACGDITLIELKKKP